MMYGYFIKRNQDDFVINIELAEYASGYNVVPKSVDKWNAYDIDEIRTYAQEHPEMEVAWSEEEKKYIPVLET